MATGFPAATGDVLSAAMFNGLVAFTLDVQTGTTYTVEATDQYQVLVVTSNASAKTVSIPTDATYNFPVGTAIAFLNTGAGDLTIQAVTSGTTAITSSAAIPAAPKVGQYKGATAIKISANAWTIVGAVS
jgi:hypothetical protein